MNTEKLLTLIDQHSTRHANYRFQTEQLRKTTREVAQFMAELAPEIDDVASDIVNRPLDALASVTPDELAAAGIATAKFTRFVASKRLADRLRSECEALAVDLKQSQALTERLVEYARLHGEVVHL